MFHIILFEPEIPPNTGNIIRLCANTGTHLHLIHPLGFDTNIKSVRRSGLDYHSMACVFEYSDLSNCIHKLKLNRVFSLTTKTNTVYSTQQFSSGDAFLFGPESRGLPADVLKQFPLLTIPMQNASRSLNLSNSVSIVLYEALRQTCFQFHS